MFGIPFPGGGGGAGGYVVIQAKGIDVSGQLFANGGWGGYGRLANGVQGDDGLNGCVSDTVNNCGTFSAPKNGEGMGGWGGIGASLPTAGDKPTSTSAAPVVAVAVSDSCKRTRPELHQPSILLTPLRHFSRTARSVCANQRSRIRIE